MILIIAEKPSLARNIAAGIGRFTRRNGFLEGENLLITWAFGHLFELCDVETYLSPSEDQKEAGKHWSMEGLPCFPQQFRYQLRRREGKEDDGVRTQWETIRTLCCRSDVDTIVNAGDADREGEIIVRKCIEMAGAGSKKQLRLWLPDQTPQTVAQALREMKPEDAYDNLAAEGYARTYIDWLYGVNLTRYATLRTGTLLRVGRVIIPIVKAIYDRDMSIRHFKPETYYMPVSRVPTGDQTVELCSKKKFKKDQLAQAEQWCRQLNAAGALVSEIKKKKSVLQPGKLYSLSKLQNVLSKKYKMSMTESLAIVQNLYENGYLTYPRTNSEYLATAEKDKVRKILEQCKSLGYPVAFRENKTIFDDSKIESHSALTPTYKIPGKDALSDAQRKVYATVFRRFVAVFCAEECRVQRTDLTVDVGALERFTLHGTVMLKPGWTKYDDYTAKDKILPDLHPGDSLRIDFKPVEKETTPPRHYTVETLNNYLKNPFREEKQAAAEDAKNAGDGETEESGDAEDYRAIFEGLELGTEATRTGIIDNARKSGYIDLKKDVYTLLPGGEFLIRSLEQMNISMDKYKTSQLGQALKKVFHGSMTIRESVALAEQEITEIFHCLQDETKDIGWFGDPVGRCPLCGREVRRTRFGYGCSGYRENGCRFTINLEICGKVLALQDIRRLLETGSTGSLDGFLSKRTGRPFRAALRLQDGKTVFDFTPVSPDASSGYLAPSSP